MKETQPQRPDGSGMHDAAVATAPGGAPALVCDGIVKRFGDRDVLAGVSLTIGRGEFVALLGPNGAGKSTLFQILTGLFTTDGGRLSIAGIALDDASRWPRALARMGVVFQQSALDLDLSIVANLRFHAAMHGMTAAQAKRRIDALLPGFQLAERANDRCRALSGGMRRKVELARALLTQPDLLLMDEATVGLDPASRVQLRTDVRAACRDGGSAALWATHLTEEVDGADRVVVLHRGKVLFDGRPDALVASQSAATIEQAFITMTRDRKENRT